MKYFAFAILLSVAGCCSGEKSMYRDCCISNQRAVGVLEDSLRTYHKVAGIAEMAVLQTRVDSLKDVVWRYKRVRKHDLLGLGWFLRRGDHGEYYIEHLARTGNSTQTTTDPYTIGLWNQALNLRRELIAVGGPSEWEDER